VKRLIDLDQHICTPDVTLREAIGHLDRSAHLFQIVVDADRRLVGTLTDGDVRRAMLGGVSLESPVRDAMNGAPVAGVVGDENANGQKLALVKLDKPFLPIVDASGMVCEILVGSGIPESDLHALVMAGGSGLRLGERTRDIPKPLLPVGGKPILAHVLDSLESAGIADITVSVHYLAEKIEEFLDQRGSRATISTMREDQPLGTAGAVGRLGQLPPKANVLVVNGDIVTQVDFAAMHDFHDRHGYDGTIAVIRHETDIPFGVVRYGDDGLFQSIDEKPVLSHFVAAGVYMLRQTFAGLVSQDGPMDMTELLNAGRQVGLKIGLFPIHEYWVDVGRPDDLDRAMRDHTQQAG